MNLRSTLYKNVQIDFIDGKKMRGYVDAYFSADDNAPDPESIVVNSGNVMYEIAVDEIKHITIFDT